MKEAYEKKYHEVEKTHFWFKARRRYILQLLHKFAKNASIIDIGCSSGILLNELEHDGFDVNKLYGIDISPVAIENCKANGIQNSYLMDAQNIDLEKKFDVAIASDCLEHIENDKKALQNWFDLLNPKGTLLVFVPALMSLWSEHDVANMHFRRYTKKELKSKLLENGFEIKKSGYWNFFLFFPVFLSRILSKLITNKKQNADGDIAAPTLFNNAIFNILNFENKLLKILNFPFGISAYCVAVKPVVNNNQPLSYDI